MQGTGGFSVFRMGVREASDEQEAEQNEGAAGSGACERVGSGWYTSFWPEHLCERGYHEPRWGGMREQQGGTRHGV